MDSHTYVVIGGSAGIGMEITLRLSAEGHGVIVGSRTAGELAGMTGVTAVDKRKLYQVMDYLTVTNHADIEFIVLINEKVWQGLTGDQQAVIGKAARRVEKDLRDKMGQLEAAAFDAVRDKIEVIELTPEQLKDWQDSTVTVIDSFVKNAGPLGKQLVEAAKTL